MSLIRAAAAVTVAVVGSLGFKPTRPTMTRTRVLGLTSRCISTDAEDLPAQGLWDPVQLVSGEVIAVDFSPASLRSRLVPAVDEV